MLRSAERHVIVDCGEVGMRGRGGHGHNDILSFELFLNGINVVTDCGAYLYTASREWRNPFRSTAFHNTVQVDDEELNRFIGPDALWQLHYDARPVDRRRCRHGDRVDCFRGGHTGYARLAPPVSHARGCFVDTAASRACSFAIGSTERRPCAGVALSSRSGGRRPRSTGATCACRAVAGHVWLLPDDAACGVLALLEAGWVSPSYGVKVPTTVLVVEGRRHGADRSVVFVCRSD